MSAHLERVETPPRDTTFSDALYCEECSRQGACQIGHRRLCLDCYVGAASCCPEFGKDDLTGRETDPEPKENFTTKDTKITKEG
jgi:hypothetical protein